jgi:ABC-type transport system substrate-binding protein
MSADRVRAALRAEAAAHQPDRAAILARIERGKATLDTARAPRTGRPRAAVRMAGIVMTVLAILGLGMAVTWAAVGTDVLRKPAHGPMMAPAPASGTPEAAQSPASDGRPQSASHAPRSPAPSPSIKGSQQSFLRSSGATDPHSIDNWTQGNVTVVTSDTVTALEVTVRIAGSPNLANTGAWSTVLAEFLVTSIEQQPDALVYRFTLKPGVTLAPASYVFAVQYNHAGGRDPSRDTYHVAATAGAGRAEVSGGF